MEISIVSIPSRVLISSNWIAQISNQATGQVSIPSRVLISSNIHLHFIICFQLQVSIPSRVLISSNQEFDNLERYGCDVSIPSRVLISSNTVAISDLKGNMIACQSLQGFSYLLTLSLQSRYFSMLIHHFAGQIHFSLYHPIHTYAKMPFSPVFMLCAADFTKYTSIMFSMSINLTIILYIMQVLLATVLASFY